MKWSGKIKTFSICLPLLVCSLAGARDLPQRIVSLAPSVTESLYALGVEDKLVGVTSYCDYPAAAADKTRVGTLINPNLEKILSLAPDLVLTVKNVTRPHVIDKLRRLGVEVVVLPECRCFSDILVSFRQLSARVGREDAAEEIIRQAGQAIAAGAGERSVYPMRVFCQMNTNPLVTVGGNTFVNDIIDVCGGTNIFAGVDADYPRLNCEEVLLKNPQVILLVTMGDVDAGQRRFWQKFKEIDAVKNNRIYVVDANLLCRPTLRGFLEGVETVRNILNQ